MVWRISSRGEVPFMGVAPEELLRAREGSVVWT